MDDYPEHLSPGFLDSGAVQTPFDEWWPQVSSHFFKVPEDAARYWLHEHWSHSPFSWLQSVNYDFCEMVWPINRINEIHSRWCDYEPGNELCRQQGSYILTLSGYRTAAYMNKHGNPPVRLVVMDNNDGHLVAGVDRVPSYENVPRGYFIVEGHRRFNMSLALASENRLGVLPIWLMTRVGQLK